MKYLLVGTLVCALTPILNAQGIHFEQRCSWQQMLNKAKSEGKYIFVDFFATWCEPCKAMDRDTYNDMRVGDAMNGRYISVKIQMDRTTRDSAETRQWYQKAKEFGEQYRVEAYPTFLFFSPDGNIIHRGMGYKDPVAFVELAAAAADPERQCYTLVDRYHHGRVDYALMPRVIQAASIMNDSKLARTAARDYVEHYLNQLAPDELYKKEYFELARPVLRSSDKLFTLCYRQSWKVDALFEQPGFSQGEVDYIIGREEIDPVLAPADRRKEEWTEPDWSKLSATVAAKYDVITADRTILAAKVRWYGFKKAWAQFTANTVLMVEKYGSTMSGFDLDVNAWTVFEHSANKMELNAAVSWIKRALSRKDRQDGPYTDTYANLLYKLGRTGEAISLEQEALRFAESAKEHVKEFTETLEKMRKEEPTWPPGP